MSKTIEILHEVLSSETKMGKIINECRKKYIDVHGNLLSVDEIEDELDRDRLKQFD